MLIKNIQKNNNYIIPNVKIFSFSIDDSSLDAPLNS